MNYWNDFYRFLLVFVVMFVFTACGGDGDGLGEGSQYDPEGFVRYEALDAILKVRTHASKTPPDCDAIGKEGTKFRERVKAKLGRPKLQAAVYVYGPQATPETVKEYNAGKLYMKYSGELQDLHRKCVAGQE